MTTAERTLDELIPAPLLRLMRLRMEDLDIVEWLSEDRWAEGEGTGWNLLEEGDSAILKSNLRRIAERFWAGKLPVPISLLVERSMRDMLRLRLS